MTSRLGPALAALCAVVFVMAAPTAPARADASRPWAEGVSAEAQGRATELMAAGNELVDQGLVAQALATYQRALAEWDHPAIRYNLAVAFINFDRPLDALEQLEHALHYGPDALEPDVYKQALEYWRLLEAQTSQLVVTCSVTGATISLDGRDLLQCPGEARRRVTAGPHRLLGEKRGYLAHTIDLALAGGTSPHVDVELRSLDDATRVTRRWSPWKPWAVAGTGVALSAAGLGFALQARATLRSYDNAVAVLCGERPCATLPALVSDAYDRGRTQNAIGVGLLAAGGAGMITGVVLVLLNREHREQLGYPMLAPSLLPGGAALSLSIGL
jgi:tetratricopeptide (TPR) repeat protein